MESVTRRVFSGRVSAVWPALLLVLFVWSGVLASAWAQGATVTTLAGTAHVVGSADGVGAAASFDGSCGVACDAAGHVHVADTANHTIRSVAEDDVAPVTTALRSLTAAPSR